MASILNVAAFAGSLRKESINRLLLRSAMSMTPEGMEIQELDIHEIPLFNQDLEDQNPPTSIVTFKELIKAADGLLIITPEYNWGIPSVTKNLIDWASRRATPPGNVLLNKPTSIMSISGTTNGVGALARRQLRDVIVYPRAIPMPSGDVGLSGGLTNFDDNGNLVDEAAREQVKQNLVAFSDWIKKLNG